MVRLKLIFLLITLLLSSKSTIGKEEEFSEALLLRPLPDRKVLAHFHFESKVPPTHTHGRHHHLFPKSIYQLVHKFRIREMELSFTQGRWNYEQWGGYDPIASNNAKPPGVELWAVFDVPQDQVDASWKNLTHALSGLFCASVNFLESSTAYAAPQWSFRSVVGNLRYGTLPREAVCTENLTPWLKLLPCRDKAGIAALMDRPSIYRGFYHSQRLHLISDEFSLDASSSGVVLEQTLTTVLQPNTFGSSSNSFDGSIVQPSWSLSSLFGRKVSERCSLSKSSNVYVHLDKNLVSKLKTLWKKDGISDDVDVTSDGSWKNPSFEMSIPPARVIKEVYTSSKEEKSILCEFSIEHYSQSRPFDLGFRWKLPVLWSSHLAPLHASRFLMGSGNERGAIAISLKATGMSDDSTQSATSSEGRCFLRVNIFQVVPWYVKVYYHTLKIFLDGHAKSTADIVEKMRVSPSEDKVSPGLMEITLRLACDVNSATLTLEFDKGFLHIDEYPPDANQGFDIPSAVISFPEFKTSLHLVEDSSANTLPILSKLQDESPVLSYTEVLLVPLTTPDFSMPYNVITITCTVFALYFGSLLNALRRRAGEEERLLKSKADNSPPSEAQYGNMQLSRAFDIVFPSSQFKIVGTDEAKMQNLSNQKLKDWGKESESLMASGGVFFPPGTPRASFTVFISVCQTSGMDALQVNYGLLSELEFMGFSESRAKKALQFSVIIDIEGPSISEEVESRAQALSSPDRDRARSKMEEEAKKLEREREKERIQSAKELLMAKRRAEETERERFIAQRKKDKEEERRARDRVRQKLLQDKAERMGIHGASLMNEEKRQNPLVTKSAPLPDYSAQRTELMRECLRSLRRQYKEDDTKVKRAFQTLLIYCRNVANNPDEEKFRKIRLRNPAFQARVGFCREGIQFLELCGFERVGGDQFLFLPREKLDMAVLKSAGIVLHSAITNPFFGLLSK
nr:GPI transamidase component PIG-T [Ipomoea batatas]